MCGICGFVNISDKDLLLKMVRALTHRGPDSEGMYFCENIGLGIRRLKVIDLAMGDQPIYNEDKTVCVVYNGEIYNFKELRKFLEQKKHKFYTKTDTEVIVHMYEEFGKDCVKHFEGMFSFALWDVKEKQLMIARDHIGIKPMFYSVIGDKLLFSSEIKSILLHNEIKKEINYNAIDLYLSYLYIPSPMTIFKDIYKLLPGHFLLWKNGVIKIEKYWDLENLKFDDKIDEESCVEQLTILIKDVVEKHLISDVPLGIFLSGGLDSSSIVAIVSEITNKPIKTFNISYGKKDAGFNETKKSQIIAKKFKSDHWEEVLEPKLKDFLPKIVNHFDEPFADSSAIPTYLVSQVARKNVTVALTGIGGDELFIGYPRYIAAGIYGVCNNLPYFLRYSLSKLSQFIPEKGVSKDWLGRIKRFLKNGIMELSDAYKLWMTSVNSQLKNNLYTKQMFLNVERDKIDNGLGYDIEKYFKLIEKNFLEKIFYVDLKTYLTDDLLCLADRMSMANSLELRVPFCDVKLVEFMAKIPFRWKLKNKEMKYLLKKVMKKILPKEILYQKKMGFMIPLSRWLREESSDLLEDYLNISTIKNRGIFQHETVSWMIKQHLKGKYNFADQIWAMLVLEEWNRKFMK
ncbi:MAG: asparagine synthase (glutamine-hydrolyzing) [Endomicrobiia bacterium]